MPLSKTRANVRFGNTYLVDKKTGQMVQCKKTNGIHGGYVKVVKATPKEISKGEPAIKEIPIGKEAPEPSKKKQKEMAYKSLLQSLGGESRGRPSKKNKKDDEVEND